MDMAFSGMDKDERQAGSSRSLPHLETEEASRAPEDLKSASSVILRAVLASITTTTTHSCSLGVAYRAVPAGLPVLV